MDESSHLHAIQTRSLNDSWDISWIIILYQLDPEGKMMFLSKKQKQSRLSSYNEVDYGRIICSSRTRLFETTSAFSLISLFIWVCVNLPQLLKTHLLYPLQRLLGKMKKTCIIYFSSYFHLASFNHPENVFAYGFGNYTYIWLTLRWAANWNGGCLITHFNSFSESRVGKPMKFHCNSVHFVSRF